MSLFKRGNVWWAYFYRDGVRHQYSTGTANRKKAETVEGKLKEELNNRRFDIVQIDPQMPFDDLAARFVASGSVRPHHLYHLKFLLPFFSGTVVLRITKSLAEEFRRERHRHNPSIKDATVNRDLSVLRHILYWAVDEQLIPANPLARLKMARERRTRRQVLSVAEEQSLLSAATGHLATMIVCALDIRSEMSPDVELKQPGEGGELGSARESPECQVHEKVCLPFRFEPFPVGCSAHTADNLEGFADATENGAEVATTG